MTEKQIKQKLRCLYKGWSLSGLAEQEQDIEFNRLLEQLKLFTIHGVSKSIAKKYAEFCVECDRKGLPLLLIDDYIEQYCC
jgi:hypothetical protein|tara:strand:- start:81 stop:323 length:243 start_codon:yes stop_codon:yes gene_type:complete